MHDLGFGEQDFRWLTAQQLSEQINVDGALGGMFSSHCAIIHPARLARGLADVVERQGVMIY